MTLAYQEYYTAEDYLEWKGDWELIEGMPYAMTPSPKVSHQIIAGKLLTQLNNAISNQINDCGSCHTLIETDWYVSNDTIVRPDVMVVCHEVNEKIKVTPDLIVEVVSASSTKRDKKMKFDLYQFDLYQKEGVLFYILAYPEKRLAKVYRSNKGDFRKTGDYCSEKFKLKIKKCNIMIDFNLIWH